MTPKQFQSLTNNFPGHLIHLQPLRLSQLQETYGAPAVAQALRTLTQRVRAKLIPGGAVTRRGEGDLLVFLPTKDIAIAQSWANEISALASMIGIRTPDGQHRMPFAIRAKAAAINSVSALIEQPKPTVSALEEEPIERLSNGKRVRKWMPSSVDADLLVG